MGVGEVTCRQLLKRCVRDVMLMAPTVDDLSTFADQFLGEGATLSPLLAFHARFSPRHTFPERYGNLPSPSAPRLALGFFPTMSMGAAKLMGTTMGIGMDRMTMVVVKTMVTATRRVL